MGISFDIDHYMILIKRKFSMLALIIPAIFGLITGQIAKSKGRSWFGWSLLGCIFGPVPLVYLLLDIKFAGVTRKWNWKTGFIKWEKRRPEKGK